MGIIGGMFFDVMVWCLVFVLIRGSLFLAWGIELLDGC